MRKVTPQTHTHSHSHTHSLSLSHTHTHTHTHAHIHTHTRTHAHARTHTHTHTHTSTHTTHTVFTLVTPNIFVLLLAAPFLLKQCGEDTEDPFFDSRSNAYLAFLKTGAPTINRLSQADSSDTMGAGENFPSSATPYMAMGDDGGGSGVDHTGFNSPMTSQAATSPIASQIAPLSLELGEPGGIRTGTRIRTRTGTRTASSSSGSIHSWMAEARSRPVPFVLLAAAVVAIVVLVAVDLTVGLSAPSPASKPHPSTPTPPPSPGKPTPAPTVVNCTGSSVSLKVCVLCVSDQAPLSSIQKNINSDSPSGC